MTLFSSEKYSTLPEIEVLPSNFDRENARELVRKFFLIKNSLQISNNRKLFDSKSDILDIKDTLSLKTGIIKDDDFNSKISVSLKEDKINEIVDNDTTDSDIEDGDFEIH